MDQQATVEITIRVRFVQGRTAELPENKSRIDSVACGTQTMQRQQSWCEDSMTRERQTNRWHGNAYPTADDAGGNVVVDQQATVEITIRVRFVQGRTAELPENKSRIDSVPCGTQTMQRQQSWCGDSMTTVCRKHKSSMAQSRGKGWKSIHWKEGQIAC